MVDERKRKTIVYVVFAGAVIFGAINFTGRKSLPVENGDVVTAGTALAVSPIAGSDSTQKDDYGWERDPFAYGQATARTGGTEERTTRFHLAAVSEANGKLMAIINGKPLMRGESIDGWTLTSLSKTGAVLTLNGREIALEIGD